MSVDDRLRTGLALNADSYPPETERSLASVLRRQRRRRSARRLAMVVVAAVVLGVAWVSLPPLVDRFRRPALVVGQTPAGQALTGSFTARVSPTSDHALTTVEGRWRLVFRSDGLVDVAPPAGYSGVVSAVLFSSTPDVLRISLFEQDLCSGSGPGRYRWVRSGERLVLLVEDDACADRVAVLARGWEQT